MRDNLGAGRREFPGRISRILPREPLPSVATRQSPTTFLASGYSPRLLVRGLPGRGVVEVEAAGAVEGFLWCANGVSVGQDGGLVVVVAGSVCGYGDFRRIHRMGLIACSYRAAESRHKEIELTADELLQYLDTKSERRRKR